MSEDVTMRLDRQAVFVSHAKKYDSYTDFRGKYVGRHLCFQMMTLTEGWKIHVGSSNIWFGVWLR